MIRMLRRRQSTKGRTLRPLVLLLWLLLLERVPAALAALQPYACLTDLERPNAHDVRGDGMAVAAAPGVNSPVQRTGAP
eukprot:COSAG01_NODE_28979_length_648_cov_0.876138_1_plen_79_part_00